jgi:hypothetical protein
VASAWAAAWAASLDSVYWRRGGGLGGGLGGFGGVLLNYVFVDDDRDEGGGGDGDESSYDAGEGGAYEQGDEKPFSIWR